MEGEEGSNLIEICRQSGGGGQKLRKICGRPK